MPFLSVEDRMCYRTEDAEKKKLMITVSNEIHHWVGFRLLYWTRAGKGKKGSALANPFKMQDTAN